MHVYNFEKAVEEKSDESSFFGVTSPQTILNGERTCSPELKYQRKGVRPSKRQGR